MKKGRYALYEPFCGSAALTMHLLGSRRQILPYQGSKWKIRRELTAVLHELGHLDPWAIHLNDQGPWGLAFQVLHRPVFLEALIATLEAWCAADPEELYRSLHGAKLQSNLVLDAAAFLFLQRLSYSGKAVSVDKEGRWKSPGFNKTSAYGTPATARFSEVKPMLPSLVRCLKENLRGMHWPADNVVMSQENALDCNPFRGESPAHLPRVAYLDPPYQGTTGYPHTDSLSVDQVVALAISLKEQGFRVLLSESESLEPLLELGWSMKILRGAPVDGKPFHTKNREILMVSP